MKTLFVSDLDGTLLTKEGRVSDYSCERLNRMLDAGMTFTYATARSAVSARRATQGLNITAPAVYYNGGLIYNFHTGEVLRAVLFQEDVAGYILSVLRNYGVMPFAYSAVEKQERVSWLVGKESEGMKRYLSYRKDDKRLAPVYEEGGLLTGRVFYFKCIGPFEQLAEVWNILKYDTRIICIFHQETYHQDFWMEISPREATKANAVTFLKQQLGCDRIVCFGDSSNDSDMFDVCEEKHAVQNADDWLKAKATSVVGYCEEDGVAKWLESYSGF
ncbi:MAG: Cof-type HAD-IIB family hydrolase [Clostridia bacterium]|nr:Cof-type HAD-IIB family hydrolase [Clostridia bacterium]